QRQLQKRLHKLATVDELTKLCNRREFDRNLAFEAERFRRYGQVYSLMMIDVDHFKSVNDTHGHQVGDRVLRWVADTIRGGIRSIDVAGRFGGEEFAVILPSTGLSVAQTIAERLREGVAEKPFSSDGTEITVTVSIGVAESNAGTTVDD